MSWEYKPHFRDGNTKSDMSLRARSGRKDGMLALLLPGCHSGLQFPRLSKGENNASGCFAVTTGQNITRKGPRTVSGQCCTGGHSPTLWTPPPKVI